MQIIYLKPIVLVVATAILVQANTRLQPAAAPKPQHQQQADQQQDLIQIHESATPFNCLGAKASELAHESQVVGVYFDSVTLNMTQEVYKLKLDQKSAANSIDTNNNKTKQSQEFELDQSQQHPSTTTTTSTSSCPLDQTSASSSSQLASSSEPSTSSAPASSSSSTSSSGAGTSAPSDQQQPVTGSPEPAVWTPGETPNDAPVGSRTARQGDNVFCGEANANGQSNKRLVSDRIVGGHKAEPGEFPFQVRLNIRSRRGSGICGGVILDRWHILTAAHCMTACVSQQLTTGTIESAGVRATIGDHSIRSNDGEVEIDIDKITPHEKYDACNFYANDHDIAMVKTSAPIEYRFTTDGYGSINRPCLPSSPEIAYKEGEKVIVSGWGVTRENSGALSNILRYVQVPIVNTTRCQETYGSRVTNDHVCAGLQMGGKDSCQGDSGGPLVRVLDNRYELVGIVSFGYGCGQPSAPGVYTRVASYLDWIKANL